MTWFVADEEPVAVPLGSCHCPQTPHPEGDTIFLRKELDAYGGLAIVGELASDADGRSPVERLGRAYLDVGIVAWTFVDSDEKPIPVTRENIRRLRWGPEILAVANAAGDLYASAVLDPFVQTTSASSPSGRSASSTSRTRRSSRELPAR